MQQINLPLTSNEAQYLFRQVGGFIGLTYDRHCLRHDRKILIDLCYYTGIVDSCCGYTIVTDYSSGHRRSQCAEALGLSESDFPEFLPGFRLDPVRFRRRFVLPNHSERHDRQDAIFQERQHRFRRYGIKEHLA